MWWWWWLPCVLPLFVGGLLLWWHVSRPLSSRTLEWDLSRLRDIFGPDAGDGDVVSHYTHTTGRDYRLLRCFLRGPCMHTVLTPPTGGMGSRQPMLVLSELRAVDARRVLEIGCGTGYCTGLLAATAPDIHFDAIDLVPVHIEQARRTVHRRNARFHVADGRTYRSAVQYDAIFGVESLCYMGGDVDGFLRNVRTLLRPGGRLILVDGFRTVGTTTASKKTAMRTAERGFRVAHGMPSKSTWIRCGRRAGFTMVRNLDLTAEALPFWTLGWRVARPLLLVPWLVRWYIASAPARRRETGANLAAVATAAHALRNRAAAEYGLLVLSRH